MHCFYNQLSEKIYRSLDDVTRKLRFTLPFPMLAYPVYLVSLLHFVNCFIVSSSFLCKINFPFSLICLWYLIIVGSNSWKEGLSLPPKQWFVCPKWKKICYHLNRLLDRNGWTTCVFKFCNGSCPNAETLWHSLLGRFSFSCLIYILLNNAWIISVLGKNVFD